MSITQKSWEKNKTLIKSGHICPCCNEPIINHIHYTDTDFCESCKQLITEDYNSKLNNPDDQEQINYFGWNTAGEYLKSVYQELTNNNDSIYWE